MNTTTTSSPSDEHAWKKTACIICALNCGLEVQTEGRNIIRIRADKAHPVSQGYLCEKAQRMDYYQNGADRIDSPLRRRADGSYEAIDWDTAISEIATKLTAIQKTHGGDKILYYGGGSQGNHLGATYADNTIKALGIKYRSNALAQEKTGEAWVQGRMMGAGVHCDFEHAQVAVFLGKNPWQSHGFARARVVLKEIQKDPSRTLIVIDPRKTETAAMADIHLAVKPGTDAWCLAAMIAVMVQEGIVASDWLAVHTTGYSDVAALFKNISVPQYAEHCGVDEALIRSAARSIAKAESVSMLEDLGVQMNIHSTLNSYLNRLVWLLAGQFGRKGTNNTFVPLMSLSSSARENPKRAASVASNAEQWKKSPVTGFKVVMGLIPCNAIPEEILTDHPKRFRAMFIESANPVHSLADSAKMRESMRALELSVVIDVAMSETAQQADYVLPASSQFEKAEATFFNLEITHNAFHLRQPLFTPREGTLSEAEIHSRLVEAITGMGKQDYGLLNAAAKLGLNAYGLAFAWASNRNKNIAKYPSVALYRTLGARLPAPMRAASSLWGVAQMYVRQQAKAAAQAGFGGMSLLAGNRLFQAILNQPSGVVFSKTDYADSWLAVRRPEHRISLWMQEFSAEIESLQLGPAPADAQYPLYLSAGERRTETSNTSIRDSGWNKKADFGTLRASLFDAQTIGAVDGEWVRVMTQRGEAIAPLEINTDMQAGHISLPNGLGIDYSQPDGSTVRKGVSLNELTDYRVRDPFVGTPWHKRVAARIEKVTA